MFCQFTEERAFRSFISCGIQVHKIAVPINAQMGVVVARLFECPALEGAEENVVDLTGRLIVAHKFYTHNSH